jgi:hypothetical protein
MLEAVVTKIQFACNEYRLDVTGTTVNIDCSTCEGLHH